MFNWNVGHRFLFGAIFPCVPSVPWLWIFLNHGRHGIRGKGKGIDVAVCQVRMQKAIVLGINLKGIWFPWAKRRPIELGDGLPAQVERDGRCSGLRSCCRSNSCTPSPIHRCTVLLEQFSGMNFDFTGSLGEFPVRRWWRPTLKNIDQTSMRAERLELSTQGLKVLCSTD